MFKDIVANKLEAFEKASDEIDDPAKKAKI